MTTRFSARRNAPVLTAALTLCLWLGLIPSAANCQTAARAGETAETADRLNRTFQRIAESVTPAVVSIISSHHTGERTLSRRGETESLGSGVIVSPEGYLLTNNHVIEGAEKIRVLAGDGRTYEAEVVGADYTTDLAVLRLLKLEPGNRLPVIRFGDSDSCRIGAWVLAIGNPMELGISVTAGIISAKSRRIDILSGNPQNVQGNVDQSIESFIQTDAVINPGNSGGALVNLKGELIGINTAIASSTGVYQGYGFAIPVNLARRVMEDLIEMGRVVRPVLGVLIQTVNPVQARALGLPRPQGVLIEDFSPRQGSPAESAGLARGDVVLAVDGREVNASHQLQEAIAKHRQGETVRVRVFREGRNMEFSVKLGGKEIGSSRPDKDKEEPEPPRNSSLGLQLRAVTARDMRELGLADRKGVLVEQVTDGGVALRSGLIAGDVILKVNRRTVGAPAEVENLLDGIKPGEAVLFMVLRDGTTHFVGLEMP